MSAEIADAFIKRYNRLPTEIDPDYLEMLRMSKYRILERPDVNPAKCANCGGFKDDGRLYIDFGLQVDWYGAVFLCGHCLSEISIKMGLHRALEVKILQLEEKIEELKGAQISADDLRSTVLSTYEEVKSYFDNLPATGASGNSNRLADVGLNKTATESVPDISGAGPTKPEPRAPKSNSSPGRSNIPKLADLLENT